MSNTQPSDVAPHKRVVPIDPHSPAPPAPKHRKLSFAAHRRSPEYALQSCLEVINSPAGIDVLQPFRAGEGIRVPEIGFLSFRFVEARQYTVAFSAVPGKWGSFSKTNSCVFLTATPLARSPPGQRHCGLCGMAHPISAADALYIRRKRLGPAANKRYAYFVGCKRCDRLRDAKRAAAAAGAAAAAAAAPPPSYYHDEYLIWHDAPQDWYGELGPGRAPARPGEWCTRAVSQIVEVFSIIFMAPCLSLAWFETLRRQYTDHPSTRATAAGISQAAPEITAYIPLCMNETWTAPIMALLLKTTNASLLMELPPTTPVRRILAPQVWFEWTHDRYISDSPWYRDNVLQRLNRPVLSDGRTFVISSRTGTGKSWAIARAMGARFAALGPANCFCILFLPRVRLTESESEVIVVQLKALMEEKRITGTLGKWDRMPKILSYLNVYDNTADKSRLRDAMRQSEVVIMSPITYGLMGFDGITPPVAPGHLRDTTVFFDEFETDAEMYTNIEINQRCLSNCLTNAIQTCALAHTIIMTEACPSYLGVAFAIMAARAGDKTLSFMMNAYMHAPKYIYEFNQTGGMVAELLGAVLEGKEETPNPTTAAQRHGVFAASMSKGVAVPIATVFDLVGEIAVCHVADPPKTTEYHNNPFDRAANADMTHPDAVWNQPDVSAIIGSCTIGMGVDSHAEGITLEGSYVTSKAASINSHIQHLGRIRSYPDFGRIVCNRIGGIGEDEEDPIITLVRETEAQLASITEPFEAAPEIAAINDGTCFSAMARVMDIARIVRTKETAKHLTWAFYKSAARASYIMHGITDTIDTTTEPRAQAMGRAFTEIKRLTLHAPLPNVTELCSAVHTQTNCPCFALKVGKGDNTPHRLHVLSVCLNRFGTPLSNVGSGRSDVDKAIALMATMVCGKGSYNRSILKKIGLCHCIINSATLNDKDTNALLSYCGAAVISNHATCTGTQLVSLLKRVAEVLNIGAHVLTRSRIDRRTINPTALQEVANQCRIADPRVVASNASRKRWSISHPTTPAVVDAGMTTTEEDFITVIKFIALSVGIQYGPDVPTKEEMEEEEEEAAAAAAEAETKADTSVSPVPIFDFGPGPFHRPPAVITINDDEESEGETSDVDEETEAAITLSLEKPVAPVARPATPSRMEDEEESEIYDSIMEPIAPTAVARPEPSIAELDAEDSEEDSDPESDQRIEEVPLTLPRFYKAGRGMLGARLPAPSDGPHYTLDARAAALFGPDSEFLKLTKAQQVTCLDSLTNEAQARTTQKVPPETIIFLPGTAGVPYRIMPGFETLAPPQHEEMIGPFTSVQLAAICETVQNRPRAPERTVIVQPTISAEQLLAGLHPKPSLLSIMRAWIREHPGRSPTKTELGALATLYNTTPQQLKTAYVNAHQHPT